MEFIINLLVTIIILCIGYGINNIYGKDINGMDGYIIGIITTSIIWMIVGNKNSFKIKNKKFFNTIALVIALIGGIMWFIGEWLVYVGKTKNSLLDPIGSFTTALGGVIGLVIYLQD